MSAKILLIDDEAGVISLLTDYFQQYGFDVTGASGGREALEIARAYQPDLIILDIMMPEMDGYTFLREYRRSSATPVIMLTARVEETDKVIGLELGADDYVTKPFSPRELVARARAVLRRTGGRPPDAPRLQVGALTLDREERQVRHSERAIDLTPTEFEILAALMLSPGRVFSRMELLEQAQGLAYDGYERTVDVHVKNLRAKLGDDANHPRLIETVYGVGYRLVRP